MLQFRFSGICNSVWVSVWINLSSKNHLTIPVWLFIVKFDNFISIRSNHRYKTLERFRSVWSMYTKRDVTYITYVLYYSFILFFMLLASAARLQIFCARFSMSAELRILHLDGWPVKQINNWTRPCLHYDSAQIPS